MAGISRRKLAKYAATALLDGKSRKDVVKELAAYLVLTKRTSEVELIVRDVEQSLASQGHVTATVTSARALSVETKKVINEFVSQQGQAKSVLLKEIIDESVIGGVKITFAGSQYDGTVKTRLEKLTAR